MGMAAAKQGDRVVGSDVHLVVMPAPKPPEPQTLAFSGVINGNLSTDVKIMGKPAAVVGSTADNTPKHLPLPPGTGFTKPPSNLGTIQQGSATVKINGKPAARAGDKAITCNDPTDLPTVSVVADGTVMIG